MSYLLVVNGKQALVCTSRHEAEVAEVLIRWSFWPQPTTEIVER